jgi:hypothetical protein
MSSKKNAIVRKLTDKSIIEMEVESSKAVGDEVMVPDGTSFVKGTIITIIGGDNKPADKPTTTKKPLLKRFWVWVLIVIVVTFTFAAMSSKGKKTPTNKSAPTKVEDKPNPVPLKKAPGSYLD